jgi:hypothetical protein
LLPRRVRRHQVGCYTFEMPRSPLGFHPLQGLPSPRRGGAFTLPPPMSFSSPIRGSMTRLSGVSSTRSPACLSRELPTLLRSPHLVSPK